MLCVLVLSHRILNRFCMKLSVVVPVYNVKIFLPRCLDSFLRQGLYAGEFEVICVNDGSPDHSAAILQEYEARHPDIFKIITQDNQGLGGARNTGTDVARGEYVTFLDSDDYMIDNAYSYLLSHFCQDKPDVLCYQHSCMYTDGKALFDPQAQPDGKVTFDGDGVDAYNRWPLPFVWSKFYKRSFIRQHQIKSQIVACQDELFNFDVFRRHPHTRIVSSNVCRYELGNENAITQATNRKRVMKMLEDMFSKISYMVDYLKDNNVEMKPAVMRNIKNFWTVYHKKLVMVFLTWKEWRSFRKRMRGLPTYEPIPIREKRARWMEIVKRWAGVSYIAYLQIYFLRNVVFLKLVRPLLIERLSM